MSLSPEQQDAVDKITATLDELRRDFDRIAGLGAGLIPGLPIAQFVFDTVDTLWDAADSWTRGEMTAIQQAVKDVDTLEDAHLKAKFPEDT